MTSTADLKGHSPTLTRLLKTRLAPIREKQLLKAASDGANGEGKPEKPGADECCGSACKPCVMDNWREEVKVWKECAAGIEEKDATEQDILKETTGSKMPGAFEW